jgi:protein-S-isoprenylcysteine O-methyltransferase Ste14
MNPTPPRGPLVPPVYLVAALALMGALHWFFPLMVFWGEPWRYLGVALIALAVVFGFWAVGLFRKADTGVVPFSEAKALIVAGPYRYTRNPMYVGMTGILLGTGVLFGSLTPFLVVPVFVAWIQWRFIHAEEAMMAEVFGTSYAQYKLRVRRWI